MQVEQNHISRPTSFMVLLLLLSCVSINTTKHEDLISSLQGSKDEVTNTATSSETATSTALDTESEENTETSTDTDPGTDTQTETPFENTHYIDINNNGDGTKIIFPDSEELMLDWTKNWSFSFIVPKSVGTGSFLQNGGNWIGFRFEEDILSYWLYDGESTWPISANFSVEILPGDRLTLSYQGVNRCLQFYVQDVLVNEHFDLFSGVSAPTAESFSLVMGYHENDNSPQPYWVGGIDQAIIAKVSFDIEDIASLLTTDDMRELQIYTELWAWWPMGEDTYPLVKDWKGSLDGNLIDGREKNFVSYSEE